VNEFFCLGFKAQYLHTMHNAVGQLFVLTNETELGLAILFITPQNEITTIYLINTSRSRHNVYCV